MALFSSSRHLLLPRIIFTLVRGKMSVILDKCVAVINFQLKTKEGTLIDSSESYSYIHGMGNTLPGIEKLLSGKSIHEEVSSEILAADGFGMPKEFEPIVYHRDQLGTVFDSLSVGQGMPFRDDRGNRALLYVLEQEKDTISFTINHPLAGKSLLFSAKILDIRCATDQELAQGYPIQEQQENTGSCSCC